MTTVPTEISGLPDTGLGDRLVDALMLQAQSALQASPGARAYYDRQRARGLEHNPELRQLANRLVGILHDDSAAQFAG